MALLPATQKPDVPILINTTFSQWDNAQKPYIQYVTEAHVIENSRCSNPYN